MWRNICETRQHWNANFSPLSLSSLYNFAHLRDTCIIQTFTYHVYRPLPQKITKQNKKKGVETFLKVNTRIYINIRYFPHITALTIGNCPLFFANEFINFLTRITLQKIICIGGWCEFIQDWQIFWDTHKNGCLLYTYEVMHILTKKMGGLVCFQALNLLERAYT